jgi:hypothetical protein
LTKEPRKRMLGKGDLVLMWDKIREKPRMHGNFDSLWFCPFKIEDKVGTNSFYLSHLNKEKLQLHVNRQNPQALFF